MRLLVGSRPDRDLRETVELALPAEGLRLCPAFHNQVERLLEALPRFIGIHVVRDVFVRDAANEARDQPPTAEHVQHGVFLGQPNRVQEWDQATEHREPRLARPLRKGRANQVRIAHQAVGCRVVLVAADPVEAELLGEGHLVEVLAIGLVAPNGIEQLVGDRPSGGLGEKWVGHQVKEGHLDQGPPPRGVRPGEHIKSSASSRPPQVARGSCPLQ